MKMMNVVLMGAMLLSANVFAGDKGGNGGDVLICKDPSKNMILDYYEGMDRGIFTSFGDSNLSIRDNFLLWIKNLASAEPGKAQDYKDLGFKILAEIETYENDGVENGSLVKFTDSILTDIPDSQELNLPQDCVKHQLVIQTNKLRGERFLKIQKNLWAQINTIQKALMIAHEVVYSSFIKKGATDSRDARYFNQLVIGKAFKDMKPCEYFHFIQKEIQSSYYVKFSDFSVPTTESCNDDVLTVSKENEWPLLIEISSQTWARFLTVGQGSVDSQSKEELLIPSSKVSLTYMPYGKNYAGKNVKALIFEQIQLSGLMKIEDNYEVVYDLRDDSTVQYDPSTKLFKISNVSITVHTHAYFRGQKKFVANFYLERYLLSFDKDKTSVKKVEIID